MKWLIAGFFVAFLLSNCGNHGSASADILPRDTMEKVMWDMIQADRFSNLYLLKDSAKINVKKETFLLYDDVFQLHKITRDQFIKSYRYYTSDPKTAREFFDTLSDRANRRRDDLYKTQPSTTPTPIPTPPTPKTIPAPPGSPMRLPRSPLHIKRTTPNAQ